MQGEIFSSPGKTPFLPMFLGEKPAGNGRKRDFLPFLQENIAKGILKPAKKCYDKAYSLF
ncbi:hypothetical protein [Merdimmobilis hominis]|uniref:hypothetical protein n=1 Tax=Merdimmobilis hominis TaxID=2897707 RepID=UPI00128F1498|nr:hypothetical protein [Merdimmobilis hominis]